jgi:hypothetical protein
MKDLAADVVELAVRVPVALWLTLRIFEALV